MRAVQRLSQPFAGDGVNARRRRGGDDFMTFLAQIVDDLAPNQAAASDDDDLQFLVHGLWWLVSCGQQTDASETECWLERQPIRLAKSGRRLLRRLIRLALSRSQHDRPMRRLKRSTPLLQGSGHCFHDRSKSAKACGLTIPIE